MTANNNAKNTREFVDHCTKTEREIVRVSPTKLTKPELEDLYFTLLETNLELKRKINAQIEQIKTLNTKLNRMSAVQKNNISKDSRTCCANAQFLIYQQKESIAGLKYDNDQMAAKIKQLNTRLCSAKQFLKCSKKGESCHKCTAVGPPLIESESPLHPKNGVVKSTQTVLEAQTTQEDQQNRPFDTNDFNRNIEVYTCLNPCGNQFGHYRRNNTNNAATQMEEPTGNPTDKDCQDNKCKNVKEEMRKQIVALQQDLLKAQDDFCHRDRQVSELTFRLSGAEAKYNDMTTELTIEKNKANETQLQVKSNSLASRIAAVINEHVPGTNLQDMSIVFLKPKSCQDKGQNTSFVLTDLELTAFEMQSMDPLNVSAPKAVKIMIAPAALPPKAVQNNTPLPAPADTPSLHEKCELDEFRPEKRNSIQSALDYGGPCYPDEDKASLKLCDRVLGRKSLISPCDFKEREEYVMDSLDEEESGPTPNKNTPQTPAPRPTKKRDCLSPDERIPIFSHDLPDKKQICPYHDTDKASLKSSDRPPNRPFDDKEREEYVTDSLEDESDPAPIKNFPPMTRPRNNSIGSAPGNRDKNPTMLKDRPHTPAPRPTRRHDGLDANERTPVSDDSGYAEPEKKQSVKQNTIPPNKDLLAKIEDLQAQLDDLKASTIIPKKPPDPIRNRSPAKPPQVTQSTPRDVPQTQPRRLKDPREKRPEEGKAKPILQNRTTRFPNKTPQDYPFESTPLRDDASRRENINPPDNVSDFNSHRDHLPKDNMSQRDFDSRKDVSLNDMSVKDGINFINKNVNYGSDDNIVGIPTPPTPEKPKYKREDVEKANELWDTFDPNEPASSKPHNVRTKCHADECKLLPLYNNHDLDRENSSKIIPEDDEYLYKRKRGKSVSLDHYLGKPIDNNISLTDNVGKVDMNKLTKDFALLFKPRLEPKAEMLKVDSAVGPSEITLSKLMPLRPSKSLLHLDQLKEAAVQADDDKPTNLDICEVYATVCRCKPLERTEPAIFRSCSGTLKFKATSVEGSQFRKCECYTQCNNSQLLQPQLLVSPNEDSSSPDSPSLQEPQELEPRPRDGGGSTFLLQGSAELRPLTASTETGISELTGKPLERRLERKCNPSVGTDTKSDLMSKPQPPLVRPKQRREREPECKQPAKKNTSDMRPENSFYFNIPEKYVPANSTAAAANKNASPGQTREGTSDESPREDSLSEGELPSQATSVNDRRPTPYPKALADKDAPTKKAPREWTTSKMEAALQNITDELARCKELLQGQRPYQVPKAECKDAFVAADITTQPISLKKTQGKSHINDVHTPKCIFTLHIGTIVLSDEAILNSLDKSLVLKWQFYDQNVTMTRMSPGRVAHFDFSTEYDMKITDEFLDYMKREELAIIICHVDNLDEPFASCSLPLRDALLHVNRRADMSLALMGGPQILKNRNVTDKLDAGDEVGVLDLWCKLRAEPRFVPHLHGAKGKPKETMNSDGYVMDQMLEDQSNEYRMSQDLDLHMSSRHPTNPHSQYLQNVPAVLPPADYEKTKDTSGLPAYVSPSVEHERRSSRDSVIGPMLRSLSYMPNTLNAAEKAAASVSAQHMQYLPYPSDVTSILGFSGNLQTTDSSPKASLETGRGRYYSEATQTRERAPALDPSELLISQVPANIKCTADMKNAIEKSLTPKRGRAESRKFSLSPRKPSTTSSMYDVLKSKNWRRLSRIQTLKRENEDENSSLESINKTRVEGSKPDMLKKSVTILPEYLSDSEEPQKDYTNTRPTNFTPMPGNDRFRIQTIDITVLWLALNEESAAMADPRVQRLYVAYSFLGRQGADLETPVSLPKPKNYADKCFFNFKKTFQLNESDWPLIGHMAGKRSTAKSTNAKDCVIFTVISEPPEDPLGLDSCEDVGYAYLYLGDLLAYCGGSDSYTEVIPVRAARAGDDVCGVLAVRLDGLDALRRCLTTTCSMIH